MITEDGNANSVDMSAVRVENLNNGDYIGPVVVETGLNTGIFRGSAVTSSSSSNFVLDSLRVSEGDIINVSPYDYSGILNQLEVNQMNQDILLGDVNDDSSINVQDVITLINYILGDNSSINIISSDINGDSYLDVMDVIGIINIILNESFSSRDLELYSIINIELQEIIKSNNNNFVIPLIFEVNQGSIGGVQINFGSNNIESLNLTPLDSNIDIFCNDLIDSKKECIIISTESNKIDVDGKVELLITAESTDLLNANLSISELIAADRYGQLADLNINNSSVQLSVIPEDYVLGNNYPNPFNPSTNIMLGMPQNDVIQAKIYNIKGQVVKNLLKSELLNEGYHKISWDGTNDSNQQLPSGKFS